MRGKLRQTKRGRRALTARNGSSKIKAMYAVARKLVPMPLQITQTGQPFDLARWCAAHGVPAPVAAAKESSSESPQAEDGGSHAA